MRIVGLDLGREVVKAVEFETSFRRYEVHDYYERPVAEGSTPYETARDLIAGLTHKPEKIAVTLSSSLYTIRNIELPTRDKKAILSAIGFELEDELPFELDELAYDYSTFSQSKALADLHVEATLRKHIADAIFKLSEVDLNPELITSECWAYRSLMSPILSRTGADDPIMLIHFGSETTNLYIHHQGKPLAIRQLSFGGKDLTQTLARKYGISLEDAEKAKREGGFILNSLQKSNATPEQLEFSDALHEAFAKLFLDIRTMNLACKTLTKQPPKTIYLTGGPTLLPGLRLIFEEELNIPTFLLRSLSSISLSGVSYSEAADAQCALAAGAALALIAPDRQKPINFRVGDFSVSGKALSVDFATLKKPLTYVGATALALLLSMIIQSFYYEDKLDRLNTSLEKNVKSFFGGYLSSSAVKTYLSNAERLKSSVKKELDKQRTLAKLFGENTHSPTDFVKTLSAQIPKTVVLDLIDMQVGSAASASYQPDATQEVTLSFLVENPQIIEKLAPYVKDLVNNVERSQTEQVPSPDGQGQRWKVTFKGQAKETAYGK